MNRLSWIKDQALGLVIGHDQAVMRRLTRAGRVIYGPGSYGVPTIMDYVYDESKLIVGNYTSMGGTFFLGGLHAIDRVTTYPLRINMRLPGAGADGYPTIRGDTHVGSDCWVGRFSLIMTGLTIGDGAIIAAGAIVTKDVPAFAIVGGNPARVIRYRFDERQREALLRIRWWDWPEDRIREAVPWICGNDIDGFIAWAEGSADAPAAPAPIAGGDVSPAGA